MKKLLFLVLGLTGFVSVDGFAQKAPPPPKESSAPPRPKVTSAPPSKMPGNTGGIRSVRLPVVGDIQLGMLRREFDSITAPGPLKFISAKKVYAVTFSPKYTGSRINSLEMTFADSSYAAFPEDILLFYRDKYGAPDSSSAGESTYQVPLGDDPAKKETIKLNSTYNDWKLRYYDLVIRTVFTDAKKGGLNGRVVIMFLGNDEYISMLKDLELRGE